MRGAGFTGRWAKLETNYRMPNDAMELARTFAEKFLPKDLIDLPQRIKQKTLEERRLQHRKLAA